MTYDVMTKTTGKFGLRETKQMIYHLKGNNESFPKKYFLLKLSDRIKRYGHLSRILADFSRFYHDLSRVIHKLSDHGCQV